MTDKRELYKCSICGNLVEVVLEGAGTLVCCGEDMELLTPKQEDVMKEKHVPVIERVQEGAIIRVARVEHPMTNEHYIQFIEALSKDGTYLKRKYLNPGDKPELKLKCDCKDGIIARELCNIHGLWMSKEA